MKLQIKYIEIEKVKPYKNNPRRNDKAIEIVKKSIKEFGFKNPIILDKNMEIIAGHTRLLAARELKFKEVPYILANDLTKSQVKAFRIMDNKSAEMADWDLDLLREEFYDLEGSATFNLTGFSGEEITELWDREKDMASGLEPEQVNRLGKHTIQCPDCGHRFERKDQKRH